MTDSLDPLRSAVREATHAAEPAVLEALVAELPLAGEQREAVCRDAVDLVRRCRGRSRKAGTLDAFLQEFGLSNKEGIALMCLAEALLRVPDEETADRLIAEKIHSGDWGAHRGKSASRFVNASVWGLMLTGRIVRLDDDAIADTDSWMRRLVGNLGEPVVRQAVLQAMRIMGGQYVLGRTIAEALQRGVSENRRGTRFSFDMLGEGARTDADARRYFDSYADAIRAISTGSGRSVITANGISVKLSALHPRYAYKQAERVHGELLPRIRELALMAARGRIGLSIDAEECDRLDLSMELFEALARDPALAGWDGLGFVLQGYQKRARLVVDWLVGLARDTGKRLPVRLVKGAYWDSEIKHAQELGLADYPVFTRKSHSDLSYEACAARLLAAPDAVYPQFATHNAHTVALVRHLAGDAEYEFQRLHGMGQLLYDELQDADPSLPVRVYAPVGNHRDLLPYLVRRLLENGANSSFVNRFLDARVAPEELLRDPLAEAEELPGWRHTRIPVPRDLYAGEPRPWENARGIDLADAGAVSTTLARMEEGAADHARAAPLVGGEELAGEAPRPAHNPACPDEVIGEVIEAGDEAVEQALATAAAAQPRWNAAGVEHRAVCLERLADTLEARCEYLMGLIAAEGGRTIEDGLSEVREAIDFCRYYAQQARAGFAVRTLPGPTGEVNELTLHGRGVFACISPWNFPVAIFTGQVAAALVAGNSVVAKPAEQTPLVAAQVVRWAHGAGVPGDVLNFLPGGGAVGAALVADSRVAGVAFTGGTDTARRIQRSLAEREGPIVPLIAETGGLNTMLVDATALPEQVVDDVIISAFQSAGQRCSALRVLYIQADIADRVLEMLAGAMRELRLGDPSHFDTDIGPVIDLEARQMLERHAARMDEEARLVAACEEPAEPRGGHFFPPRVYEIERLGQLEREVFGPILHVIRYRVEDLPGVYADINASGYGLTLGVHSRIEGFAREVFRNTRVGNTYINRNMVGAIVGVNPFGGQGLSGTGPKAGGPHYLPRFATEKTFTDNVVAKGGNTQLFNLEED